MPESLDEQRARFRATYDRATRRLGAHDWRWWRGGAGDVPVLWLTGIVGLGEFAFAPLLALGPRFRVVAPLWGRWFDEAMATLGREDIVSRLVLADEFLGSRDGGPASARPVLLVEADDHPLMPDATRAGVRRAFPDAETHTFTGTGHAAAILDPAAYARVIGDWVLAAHGRGR